MTPDRLDCVWAAFFILLAIALIRDIIETRIEDRKQKKKGRPFNGPWHHA